MRLCRHGIDRSRRMLFAGYLVTGDLIFSFVLLGEQKEEIGEFKCETGEPPTTRSSASHVDSGPRLLRPKAYALRSHPIPSHLTPPHPTVYTRCKRRAGGAAPPPSVQSTTVFDCSEMDGTTAIAATFSDMHGSASPSSPRPSSPATMVSDVDVSPQASVYLGPTKAAAPSRLFILTSFHAGYFRISLSLSGQALLWKTLTDPAGPLRRFASHFLPSTAFVLLWSIAAATLVALSLLYALRCVLRFRSVKAEFSHHVGVNYLFAPWISCLLLLQSSPFVRTHSSHCFLLWWLFAIPVLALDVKIYGQWFTKGRRFLSLIANPTSHLSVIGNLVGASAAAEMGWRESAMFMFSLGLAHYLVLFVTLYQRLIGNDKLPVVLRPVFFLFFAAPSMASLAWDSISGGFDISSKLLFFLSLFLFASLISRPALFKNSMKRFTVAWWAYSFPLTILALASTEYAQAVKGHAANCLMLVLSILSVAVSFILTVYSALNTSAILPYDDPFLAPSTVVPSGVGRDDDKNDSTILDVSRIQCSV